MAVRAKTVKNPAHAYRAGRQTLLRCRLRCRAATGSWCAASLASTPSSGQAKFSLTAEEMFDKMNAEIRILRQADAPSYYDRGTFPRMSGRRTAAPFEAFNERWGKR